MKKISIFILIVIIVASFLYVVIRYFANSDNTDNWFNNNYREGFAQNLFLRKILNLRWDGDGKSDYLLDEKYTSLYIEVDQYDDCNISEESMNGVQGEISRIINKPGGVSYKISDDTIALANDGYNSEGIRNLAQRYQNNATSDTQAVLYIMCLNRYEEQLSNIGQTVHEDGVVVFWDTIQKLASSSTEMIQTYISSTILHEFGHQLGLDHSNDTNCLMSESVESPGNAAGAIYLIPSHYCEEEYILIDAEMKSLSE